MESSKLEVEAKFTVPDRSTFTALQNAAQMGAFELRPLGTRRVVDRYLDTADKRLFQAGFACRIRASNGKRKLTVKSLVPAEGHLHRRQELEAEIEAEQPQAWAHTEVGQLIEEIRGPVPLETFFVLHQTRHQFHAYYQGQPVIEFSLDEVKLEDRPDSHSLELEAELIETGAETELALLIEALQSTWNLLPKKESKFEWALNSTGYLSQSLATVQPA